MSESAEKPLLTYDSKTVRSYKKSLALFSDLIFSLDCLKCLIENFQSLGDISRKSLLHSSIMAYFKAYQHGDELGLNRIFLATLPGDPIALHEKLKNLRDKLIAHSSGMFEDYFVGIFVDNGNITGRGHFSVKFHGWDQDTLKMIYSFICEAKNRIKNRMLELEVEFNKEVDSLDLKTLKVRECRFIAQ